MSSTAWPRGTLATALRAAHQRWPEATAPQLAILVGCQRDCARQLVRSMGLPVPRAKEQRLTWTPEMKAAIVAGALQRKPVVQLADHVGVSSAALVLGALEIIREMSCASS